MQAHWRNQYVLQACDKCNKRILEEDKALKTHLESLHETETLEQQVILNQEELLYLVKMIVLKILLKMFKFLIFLAL